MCTNIHHDDSAQGSSIICNHSQKLGVRTPFFGFCILALLNNIRSQINGHIASKKHSNKMTF